MSSSAAVVDMTPMPQRIFLASHLLEGGGGGGDGGDHGGAGEVLDGCVEEDGGHGQGGQHNQQPENLTSRLHLIQFNQ